MILALVTFRYDDEFDPEQFKQTSQSRRDFYVGLEGLRQKIYWVDHERNEAGGAYVWESREAAERVYTQEWKAKAEESFGGKPEIRYLDVTDVILNRPLAG